MAMTRAECDRPHIPQKDFYTVQDVATLLMTSEGKVRELSRRKADPLPFRCFENSRRGMFISRSELAAWVKRNTVRRVQVRGRLGHGACFHRKIPSLPYLHSKRSAVLPRTGGASP